MKGGDLKKNEKKMTSTFSFSIDNRREEGLETHYNFFAGCSLRSSICARIFITLQRPNMASQVKAVLSSYITDDHLESLECPMAVRQSSNHFDGFDFLPTS